MARTSGSGKGLKIAGLLAVIAVAAIWVVAQARETREGAAGNNGVADYIPAPTEQEREMFERMRETMPPRESLRDMSDEDRTQMRERMRERFEEMPPEQREAMEARRAEWRERRDRMRRALTDDEQRTMRRKMREMFRARWAQRQAESEREEGGA